MKTLRIATRQSPLALWQAESVKHALLAHHPHLTVELVGLTTEGDRKLDTALNKIGGKGLFVKELEQALLDGRADIAVHSMKDVPALFPEGLMLGAICTREDPRDTFVSNDYAALSDLPKGACVGTSSLRRQAQILSLRPDLQVSLLRGNVNTRLQRLDEGQFSAILLAAAGLLRLGLKSRITQYFSIEECLPAAGQGAMGVECLAHDKDVIKLIQPLNDHDTLLCVTAEREMNRVLEGGCQVPIAAHATLKDATLTLQGLVGKPDGSLLLRSARSADATQALELGALLAEDLLKQGARQIIQGCQ